MTEKTVKMSTRKGNVILLSDVLDRAHGEAILAQLKSHPERTEYWTIMIGSFFRALTKAHAEGKDEVVFRISDYLE